LCSDILTKIKTISHRTKNRRFKMKSEKRSEASKRAWETIRAKTKPKELQQRQLEAGRKMAVTKLKKKVSNAILTSASLKVAEQKVVDILEKSSQLK